MEISVMLSSHLVSIEKTLSFIKKDLKIAEEIGDGLEKEERMEISVVISSHWFTVEKTLSIMKNI